MGYINFEEALRLLKEGLRVGREGWKPAKVIRLKKGKYVISSSGEAVDLSGLGLGMNKYYEPNPEIHRKPAFVNGTENVDEVWVQLGIEDMLAEDWYVGRKDMHFDCVGGWKDTEKVRETLEGVQVDYGKGDQGIGGQCANKGGEDINAKNCPNYVCIKDDEIRGVKRGSILRFIGTNSFSDLMYYYKNSNGSRTYIPFVEIKEKYQNYQEIKKTICEVVDEWHVRYKAVEKVPDVKAVAYMVERLSEEEIKRTIDVNRNLINDCGEKLGIANDAKWQEFEIRVNGDVKEIKFENGVLVTIRIPKKG